MLPSMIWVAKNLYFFNCLLDGAHTISALRQLFFFCRRSAGTINQIIYQPFFLTAFFFLPTVNVPGFFFLFARIIIEIKKVKTIVMKAGKM